MHRHTAIFLLGHSLLQKSVATIHFGNRRSENCGDFFI